MEQISQKQFLPLFNSITTMGGFVSKQIEGSFQRQQEFMLDMNKMTMERQIQMHNQMRERMAAAQIAGAREMCVWLGSFYVLAATGMITG